MISMRARWSSRSKVRTQSRERARLGRSERRAAKRAHSLVGRHSSPWRVLFVDQWVPRGDGMLREASDREIEAIRRWRNHPKVRRASIFTAKITPERHAQWWQAVQADPRRNVFIFSFGGLDCGVVLINDHDPVLRSAEWGFFLDVDGLQARGELVPAWLRLEREAIDFAFDVLALDRIGGRTLAWNEAVLALHRRFGFWELPEKGYTTEIDGEPQRVVWTELSRDRRPR